MSWDAFRGWAGEEDEGPPSTQVERVERLLLDMSLGRRAGNESHTSQVIRDEVLVELCGWPTKIERLEAENRSTNGVVDYLLRLPDLHIHLEVKKVSRDLQDDWIVQYLRGKLSQPVELGLLTNGKQWRLFGKVQALPAAGVVRLGSSSDLGEVARLLNYSGLSVRLRKAFLASTDFVWAICKSPSAPQMQFNEVYKRHFEGRPQQLGELTASMVSMARRFSRFGVDGLRYSPEVLAGVAATRMDPFVEAFRESFVGLVNLKRVAIGDTGKAVEHAYPLPHEWGEHEGD